MKLSDLKGKKICILGFGREGKAMLEAISAVGIDCEITIADKKSEIQSTKFETVSDLEFRISDFQTGENYLSNLDRFDVIIRSPGVFPSPELEEVKDKITNSTQIFLDSVPNSTVIGITGSKGKSTTASLLYEILKKADKDVHLVGNIGHPAIEKLCAPFDYAQGDKIYVVEMSSYQLMHCSSSPQIAVATSFFPEHLDYHGSLEAYKEAKMNIARFQSKNDIIFCAEDAKDIASVSPGKQISFSASESPVSINETRLIGNHNLINIAAAYLVAKNLEVPDGVSLEVIKNFQCLPHRLQPCGEHHGIEWVDDSISTTPESAIAALDALGDSVYTLILGGQDRGNDFSALADRVARSNVSNVVLMSESGARIGAELEKATALVNIHRSDSMADAVSWAKANTKKSKLCLLSPASPSYGMFENFEERGESFLNCILS